MNKHDSATIDTSITYALSRSSRVIGPLELFVRPIYRWRLLLVFAAITAIVASVLSFILPTRYTVSTSFIADNGGQPHLPSGLAGLADQFEVGLSSQLSGSNGPQFYADLVRSRSIIRALLATIVPAGGHPARVIDLLGTTEKDSIRRVERSETAMSDRINVSFDRTTQRVDVKVWMRYPETAKAVADTLLALVDRFDRDIRRTRAGEERIFAEQQRKLAADSLRIAEDAMADFLNQNRTYQQSAQLSFQHDRLDRIISLRQELYSGLAREAAQARVTAVDTRPVLTVIDPPVLPGTRSFPRRKLIVLGGVIVVVALAWISMVLSQLLALALSNGDSDAARAIGIIRDTLHARK